MPPRERGSAPGARRGGGDLFGQRRVQPPGQLAAADRPHPFAERQAVLDLAVGDVGVLDGRAERAQRLDHGHVAGGEPAGPVPPGQCFQLGGSGVAEQAIAVQLALQRDPVAERPVHRVLEPGRAAPACRPVDGRAAGRLREAARLGGEFP